MNNYFRFISLFLFLLLLTVVGSSFHSSNFFYEDNSRSIELPVNISYNVDNVHLNLQEQQIATVPVVSNNLQRIRNSGRGDTRTRLHRYNANSLFAHIGVFSLKSSFPLPYISFVNSFDLRSQGKRLFLFFRILII